MSDEHQLNEGVTADDLGRAVRGVWVRWARAQDSPKPSWLVEWDDMAKDDPQKTVDRMIGAELFKMGQRSGMKFAREELSGLKIEAGKHVHTIILGEYGDEGDTWAVCSDFRCELRNEELMGDMGYVLDPERRAWVKSGS